MLNSFKIMTYDLFATFIVWSMLTLANIYISFILFHFILLLAQYIIFPFLDEVIYIIKDEMEGNNE